MGRARNIEDKYIRKIGLRIRALRLKAGLTQEAVEKYNVGYKHLQKIEAGTTNTTIRLMYRLAKAFKCDIRDFF